MTNEEQKQLAADINTALRGGGDPVAVERPADLLANPTEAARRKHAADSEAYTNFILGKRGPMTPEEMQWIARGFAEWDRNGRQD